MEDELNMANTKIQILESVLSKKMKTEDLLKSVSEKDLYKYFNDMVVKNIDKREELKKKNKILLEKLIVLGKKYKNIKKV